MPELSEILPDKSLRLIDLVEAAGVNVSDWSNFKGGKKNASRNPRYCFEWAFVEPRKVVVLNLWHNLMEETNEGVFMRDMNMRKFASQRPPLESRRSLRMDSAIKTAINEKLPIRVIVISGKRRNIKNPSERPSKVQNRMLDPVMWSVSHYDPENGDCVLKRGMDKFTDQFSVEDNSQELPARQNVSIQIFNRSSEIRKKVLVRANGKCEWCGIEGFRTVNGEIFLETHHIIPLSENGYDRISNVIAVCANHHREAHYGVNKLKMRVKLVERFGG